MKCYGMVPLFVVAMVCVATLAWGQAINFSVDAGAIGVGGSAVNTNAGDPAHIYYSLQDGTNLMGINHAALGLVPGDNVDALSLVWAGKPTPAFDEMLTALFCWFSVDPAAVGIRGNAPDVYSEAGSNEAAGDVFMTQGNLGLGRNWQVIDETSIGLVGPGAPEDDLDALDMNGVVDVPPGYMVFFSLAAGSPSLTAAPGGPYSPADMLLSPGDGTFW